VTIWNVSDESYGSRFLWVVDGIGPHACPEASFDVNTMGGTFWLRVRCIIVPCAQLIMHYSMKAYEGVDV
jgi:hypothetical protein